MPLSTLSDSADLDAAAIADAATRMALLQRLANLGMRLAEEICERAINAPYHPEPRHEPARAFANVSRAVRLTLVLQEKTETKLIALRKGVALSRYIPTGIRKQREEATPQVGDLGDVNGPALETSDRSYEMLREREGERFDELLSGSFDDRVSAIRADLGLTPEEDVPFDQDGVKSALESVLAKTSGSSPTHGAPSYAASTAIITVPKPLPLDSG